jgi:hypothetical protein
MENIHDLMSSGITRRYLLQDLSYKLKLKKVVEETVLSKDHGGIVIY